MKRDLEVARFTTATNDWSDPESSLTALYQSGEEYALDVHRWYLLDKRSKRRASRHLRAAMIVLSVMGALAPLLTAAGATVVNPNWGYIALALAGGCAAFDRFFGYSSAWARDMRGAQAVQDLILRFQLDWSSLAVGAVTDETTVQARLNCLRDFVTEINAVLADETATWKTEFAATGDILIDKSLSQLKP